MQCCLLTARAPQVIFSLILLWNVTYFWEIFPNKSTWLCVCSQIICNDCQAHCTVSFHVLGMKCSTCGSYNTAQDGGLITPPAVDPRQPAPQPLEEETDTQNHDWCLGSPIISQLSFYRTDKLFSLTASMSVQLLSFFLFLYFFLLD